MTEAKDIHNYEVRLNAYLRRLGKENFSADDRNLISGYIQQSRAQGIGLGRLFKLAGSLFAIRKYAPKDFRECTRSDIEVLVGAINSAEKYSVNTKSDLKKIIKKSYKYVRFGISDKTTPYPPEVVWTAGTRRNNRNNRKVNCGRVSKTFPGQTLPRTRMVYFIEAKGGHRGKSDRGEGTCLKTFARESHGKSYYL